MSESLVTYQAIGRLGNQMFQCAAAIGYAKKYKVHWACPNDTKEVPRFHEFFPNLPKYDGNEFRRYNRADATQFNYSPIPFHPNGVKLVGFWQSEKFFEGAHEEIKKVFKLNITPIDAVSIHHRLGDYVTNPRSFPPITLEYVRRVIKYFNSKGFNKFHVFSDEIAYCKTHYPTNFPKAEFVFSEGRNELEDLSLMASCKHNAIANSTFSWWAAWLNPNPDKIILSPSRYNWFGPNFRGGTPKDLIPESWTQLIFSNEYLSLHNHI